VGNTSDEFDNVVEVKKILLKKPPQRTPTILTRKEASEHKLDQVAAIEPSMKSTPSARKLFQNSSRIAETTTISADTQPLFEEKALNVNAMRFYAISILTAKLSIPSPCHSFYPLFCPLFILLFLSLASTPV